MPADPKKKITGSSSPVLQPGNLPIVRAGAWHSLPPFGAAGTAAATANRMFSLPFWPGRRCALINSAVNVTVAAVGATLRVGLYTSANGLPQALIREFGSMSLAAVGVQTFPGFSTPVEPQLYFLTMVRQGGLAITLSARNTWDPVISEDTPTLAGNLNCYYLDGVGGALPELHGPPDGSVQGPSAAVQLT